MCATVKNKFKKYRKQNVKERKNKQQKPWKTKFFV